MDKAKGVTAAVHKLARLIYAMLTRGQEYTDQRQDYFEDRYRQRIVASLSRHAQQLGMRLVPQTQTARSSVRPLKKPQVKSTTWKVLLERRRLAERSVHLLAK
jgi:hypothetical protein